MTIKTSLIILIASLLKKLMREIVNIYWRIAQLVERRAVNSNVAGSSPAPSAKIVNKLYPDMVKDCSLLTNKVSQIKNEEACNSLAGCQNRKYLND